MTSRTVRLPGAAMIRSRSARYIVAAVALIGVPLVGVATQGFRNAYASGSVSGTVYADDNHNGVQDSGELGISGVTVTAWKYNNATTDEDQVDTTTTGSDGSYTLSVATTDDVRIEFSNLGSSTPAGGGPDEPRVPNGPSRAEQFFAAGPAHTADLGLYNAASVGDCGGCVPVLIGDRVWLDRDGDGRQEAGEPGIPGVQVELLDNEAPWTPVATATTDANGYYLFTDYMSSGPSIVQVPGLGALASVEVRVNGVTTPGGPLVGLTPTSSSGGTPATNSDGTNCNPHPPTAPGQFCDPMSLAVFTGPADATHWTNAGYWNSDIDFGFQPYDLTITKTNDAAGPLNPGDTVHFTLAVTNNGPGPVNAGWTVSDLLPSGLTYGTPPAGCAVDSGNAQLLVCTGAPFPSLAPQSGGSPNVTIVVPATVDSDAVGTLTNVAWVSPPAGDIPSAETNPLVVPTLATDTTASTTNNDAQSSVSVTATTTTTTSTTTTSTSTTTTSIPDTTTSTSIPDTTTTTADLSSTTTTIDLSSTTTTTPGTTTSTTPGSTTTTTTPASSTTTTPASSTTTTPATSTTTVAPTTTTPATSTTTSTTTIAPTSTTTTPATTTTAAPTTTTPPTTSTTPVTTTPATTTTLPAATTTLPAQTTTTVPGATTTVPIIIITAPPTTTTIVTSTSTVPPSSTTSTVPPTTSSTPGSTPPTTLPTGDCSLSSVIWVDLNGNGTMDPNEAGIPGVKVRASGTGGDRTATTDGSGRYTFDAMPCGTYTVAVVDGLPSGAPTPAPRTVEVLGVSVTNPIPVAAIAPVAFTGGNATLAAALAFIVMGIGGFLVTVRRRRLQS